MSPDSLAAELVALAATVVAGVLLAVTWDVASGWRRALLRATGGALCVATALATTLVWVNRQVATYSNWSDLFGTTKPVDPAVEASYAPRTVDGRRGGRVEAFTVTGPASGLKLPVYAYLPAAYDAMPTARFPVIEALHGFPGSPKTWLNRLAVVDHLDREIAEERMAPTVVLFPYQTPDPLVDTECVNLAKGPQAETFLTVDVPAAARQRFRIRADRAGWGLIGYSAGGFCAANLVLRHPDRYAAGASLSGYADPGITIGDGSERTDNNVAWRLQHLPQPPVGLYLSCSRADRKAMRGTAALTALAHAPMSVTTAYVDGGGHNDLTWQAMEAPAFDWLSTWLGRPVPGT